MPMYTLVEYDNYSKTCGSLWQYERDVPNDDNITNSESFKSKTKITGKTPADGNIKNMEIVVPLKHLTNFWRTLEISLINYESNLNLIWRADYTVSFATEATIFVITNTKLYTLVVILSTQGNAQLLQQFKSGLKKQFE